MPHGYVSIDHPADYLADRPDNEVMQLLEELAVRAPTPVAPWHIPPTITGSSWLRVTDAVRVGDRTSVEAELPGRRASIQFHDTPPYRGFYRIIVTQHHASHGGQVSRVDRIEGNRLVEQRHAMMQPFSLRYVVATTANDRAGTQLIWRIAISDIREVQDDSAENV
jgi:hypothetical protein